MKLEHLHQYGLHGRAPATGQPPRRARHSAYPIEDLLPGEVIDTEYGGCFVVDTLHAIESRHGAYSFAELRGVSAQHLAMISRDAQLDYTELSRAVFLDTETTGLGTGTGTKIFLVGAGFFRGTDFCVRQFFLRGLGDELPFLAALGSFLDGFTTIVTFNGKAFDWPLLESRFQLHRQLRRTVPRDPLHIDLLHPARRLWKMRLESCALSALETHILNVVRTVDDVPGYMIPSLYFHYQRSGDGRRLKGIFYHNLQDILSLASLATHIDRVLAEPASGIVDHSLDFFCMAKLFDRVADTDRAGTCYEEALRRGLPDDVRLDCLTRLAALRKRQGWWDAAFQVWYRLVDEGGPGALEALIEIAKYYEHVERDYAQALESVEQAITLADLYGTSGRRVDYQDMHHRLSRLYNRASRVRQRSGQRR